MPVQISANREYAGQASKELHYDNYSKYWLKIYPDLMKEAAVPRPGEYFVKLYEVHKK